jgi:hypothetical protein
MPFYLYGGLDEMHIDHMLLHAPNAQLTASNVALEIEGGDKSKVASGLRKGLIGIVDTLPEHLMQPFTAENHPTFFRSGVQVAVTIYQDHRTSQAPGPGLVVGLGTPIAHGTITLGDSVFVDSYMINVDTPVVASHVPKKKITLPRSAEVPSQDHPLFRGYGPVSRSQSTSGHWRDLWDTALLQRRLVDPLVIHHDEPKDMDSFCPSPVAVRGSQVSFIFP